VLLFVSPSNPTGAVYGEDEMRALALGRTSAGCGCDRRDLRASRVRLGRFHSMPVLVPELAERCIIVNGVARLCHDRLAGGMADRSPDVVKRPPTFRAIPLPMSATSPRWRPWPPSPGLEDVKEMRSSTTAPPGHRCRPIRPSGVLCPEPEGAFYAFPSFAGYSPSLRRLGKAPTTTLELAELVLEEAKVAFVPVKRSERRGADGFPMPWPTMTSRGYGRLAKLFG